MGQAGQCRLNFPIRLSSVNVSSASSNLLLQTTEDTRHTWILFGSEPGNMVNPQTLEINDHAQLGLRLKDFIFEKVLSYSTYNSQR